METEQAKNGHSPILSLPSFRPHLLQLPAVRDAGGENIARRTVESLDMIVPAYFQILYFNRVEAF